MKNLIALLVVVLFATTAQAQDFLDFTGYRIGWKQGATSADINGTMSTGKWFPAAG